MRIYKDNQLVKIICNKCGKEWKADKGMIRTGVCTVETDWGYFSNKDGEHHQIDICEECYDEWIKTFCIPVSVTENTELI